MLNREWLTRNLRLIAVVVLAAIVALAVTLSGGQTAKQTTQQKPQAKSNCQPYRHDKTVKVGTHEIQAEIADTANVRAKGLGDRDCIANNEGMLFIFDKPSHYQIWMKDMKFPLDVIWISADHKVVAMEINLSPSTYPDKFINQKPAQYVLEIKGNRSKDLGIELGSTIDF